MGRRRRHPALAHVGWTPAVLRLRLRAGDYAPGERAQRAVDSKVEAWAITLEQIMSAAADHFSANGDVGRARMIRQVRGRLVPRCRRG